MDRRLVERAQAGDREAFAGILRAVGDRMYATGSNPYLSDLRLPATGWVLLAGSLADTPTNPVSQPRALLVNVETGEQIELPNLPGGDTP